MTDVSIGPAGIHGLAYTRYNTGGAGWRDSTVATMSGSTAHPVASIGGTSMSYTLSGSVYTADQADGSMLTRDASNYYLLTLSDGTIYRFFPNNGSLYNGWTANLGWVTSVTYPDGTLLTYTYRSKVYCVAKDQDGGCSYATDVRLQSVTSSLGYQLKLTYSSNTLTAPQDQTAWYRVFRVTAINNAVEYCDPAADSCALTGAWPYASYGYTGTQLTSVTDPNGKVWRYAYGSYGLTGLRNPTATSDSVVVAYAGGKVSSVAKGGGTWTYASSTSGTVQTTTVSDPLSHIRTVLADTASSLVSSDTNENGYTTSYHRDAYGRIDKVTLPEGNYASYAYDGRGNITTQTQVAKSGSGLSNLITSASYPATCANPKTCNQPTSTTDARGNVTDYTYEPSSGLVASVTAPAPAAGGVRPQTRYFYGWAQAWTKTSAGSFAAAPGIIFLSNSSTCRTTASCAGAADETKIVYYYPVGSASTGNNPLIAWIWKGAGDSSLVAVTYYGYDTIGNVTSVTDPLGAVSRAFYDAKRQVTTAIGPDPDGAGPRRSRAVVATRNDDGAVTSAAVGTINADGSGFTSLQQVNTSYDALGRELSAALAGGGTTFSLTQYSYDSVGRLQCAAVRMNPAAFGSPPASACALGTAGSFGPDRISDTVFDNAGQVDSVYTGYGTPLQRREQHYVHSVNGRTTSLTDAKGNVTAYALDGFDRPFRTSYPSPTTPGQVSATDYEQLGYDAGSNVTQDRRRDGQMIYYSYDNLGRRTFKDTPNVSYNEADVTYAYDNQGRLLNASGTNNGVAVAFAYDAFGRRIADDDFFGAKTIQYDLAGRRTRLTWTDGFYVTYDYDATGAMTAIREYGATSGVGVLATFGYDDLGRRTSLTRGNGTVTGYAYDGASRLTSLSHDLAGASADQVYTFANYSPAGEIGSRTASNDAYAWGGSVNVSRGYATNGLNQYVASGALSLSYDGRGNLTGDGSHSYLYGADNSLLVASGVALNADPLGRMVQLYVTQNGAGAHFDHDGDAMISELTLGNAMLRRYVFGPGDDEPLVWYEGSGTSDRRWLHADERGSIVAVSDASGGLTAIDSYDEYGIPAAANVGRFQYTGQAWLPELGMYDYKARMYSATLGRFLQTDPIGYGDGTNGYNYAGSNPVNGSDPSGLSKRKPGASPPIATEGGPGGGGGGSGGGAPVYENPPAAEIVVVATIAGCNAQCQFNNSLNISQILQSYQQGQPQNGFQLSQNPQPPVTCNTRLPNGKTVGQVVQSAVANIGGAAGDYDIGGVGELGAFVATVQGHGPIDFKNTMGPDPTGRLGAAGNFAYGAIASGVGYSKSFAEFGAGVYAAAKAKSNFNNPFGEDNSAAANLGNGYATNGCTR